MRAPEQGFHLSQLTRGQRGAHARAGDGAGLVALELGGFRAEAELGPQPRQLRKVPAAPAPEAKILAQIESGDRRFIVDLAQLDYISSAGLRVFVLAGKRLDGGKGKILLCSLTKPVREVFDIVGFTDTFPVYASHDDALRNI